MNTAGITGPPTGLYGVGPSRQYADRASYATGETVTSLFAYDVRAFFLQTPGWVAGGSYGVQGKRFIVGGFTDSVVIRANASPEQALASALAFADGNRPSELPNAATFGLGYWLDSDTGRVWLDRVAGFDSLTAALDAARRNGEIAIWDSRERTEILVSAP